MDDHVDSSVNSEPRPSDRNAPTEVERTGMDWGVVLLLVLLLAILGLGGWLVSQLVASSSGQAEAQTEVQSRELRRLEARVETAQRELEGARREARLDNQPATRASWTRLIETKQEELDAALEALEAARSR